MHFQYYAVAPGDWERRCHRQQDEHTIHPSDIRSPSQKDRDRVLYSTHFRRLAEITQVSPTENLPLFHTRLTHTLKVAQLARSLAERLILSGMNVVDQQKVEIAQKLGGLDPYVVEAAALAHDLGHPPFGHVTEKLLDTIILGKAVPTVVSKLTSSFHDGYEGNAQSFRIVTALAKAEEHDAGLNLTAATLNALLKYPWSRDNDRGSDRFKKYGVYREANEYEIFKGIRMIARNEEAKTLEAEIMDWADDVAYSIYDLEDYFRAGLIPFDRLLEDVRRSGVEAYKSEVTTNQFYESMVQRAGKDKRSKIEGHMMAFMELLVSIMTAGWKISPLLTPFRGLDRQRELLRRVTSFLVGRYLSNVELNSDAISDKAKSPIRFSDSADAKESRYKSEVFVLKQLTWTYVIESPELATIQRGQKKIIGSLFEILINAAEERDWWVFPHGYREQVKTKLEGQQNPSARVRGVSDVISGLTERHAVDLYHRLTGVSAASVMQKAF